MLNLRPKAARDDEPDLTPLIDMVFILLIFFILAASFAVRGIDLDLPPAHSGQALSGRVVEIRLLRDGSFLCEGIPVARTDIRAKLQSLVRDFRARPGQLVLRLRPTRRWRRWSSLDEVRCRAGKSCSSPGPAR
ncbi:MAG: ExbD/TolR family protein [Bilophila wadsworthia]